LLINEIVNDVRRVYTDGRDHTAEEDAYASWNGDILVTHTKYLMPGQYQRGVQANYSDQVTTVERWHKVDPKTLQADVWVFGPVNLAEPWYTRQSWTQLTNDDYFALLLLGERDVADEHRIVERLHRKVSNSETVVFPRVGHVVNLEAPEEFNRVVLAFPRKHSGGTHAAASR
jgi:pimeloyl-ACP methyl ester carboxylesterase